MSETSIAELEARLAAASAAPVDPVARVDALTEIAWALRNSDVPRAHGLAAEARELAIAHDYKLGQARAARAMAMTIRDNEGLRNVFQLGEEAKRLFDEVDDGPGRAASRDFLASVYEHLGDLTGALELALDALGIARAIGDPIRQGYALSNVGAILAASGETERGVERLKEALALFRDARHEQGEGTICSRLARVLKDVGRDEEAQRYAESCREMAEATDDEYLRWAGLTVIAEIEQGKGRLAEAERLYRDALSGLEPEMARDVIGCETQVALGRLLMERGALADAERELVDALRRSDRTEGVSIVAETAAHEALAELCQQRDQLGRALEHLRRAQALRQRIAQQEARGKLAQVEQRAATEAAKKDAEIHKLRFVELHGMQAKLVEAEKLALLGQLAAGTAHELNTPLGVLRSNAALVATATERLVSLVTGQGELGEQGTRLAEVLASCRQTSDEALQRIAAIAHSFTRFAQLDQAESRAFDVREGLQSALALLEPTVPDGIEIERHFDDVPSIEGWPREVNLALMTVLQNAVQAIDGAGVVSAETSVAKRQVLVRIRDSGRGMSEEQAARLFDVAWSEQGSRTRMRLGLSAAFSTMKKHGGTIEVQSTPGRGTTVTFRFPIPRGEQ